MRWTKTNIIREVVATKGPPPGALEELPTVDLAQLEAKALKMEQDAPFKGLKEALRAMRSRSKIANSIIYTEIQLFFHIYI